MVCTGGQPSPIVLLLRDSGPLRTLEATNTNATSSSVSSRPSRQPHHPKSNLNPDSCTSVTYQYECDQCVFDRQKRVSSTSISLLQLCIYSYSTLSIKYLTFYITLSMIFKYIRWYCVKYPFYFIPQKYILEGMTIKVLFGFLGRYASFLEVDVSRIYFPNYCIMRNFSAAGLLFLELFFKRIEN